MRTRTLDYCRPKESPSDARLRKTAAFAIYLLASFGMVVGGYRVALWRPGSSAAPAAPSPPVYYPFDELIGLEDFYSWSVLKRPAIPGPYAVIDGHVDMQSGVGVGLRGWVGTPQSGVEYDEPGIPDTSLRTVGVVNPAGRYGVFILCRHEPWQPATATRAARPRPAHRSTS